MQQCWFILYQWRAETKLGHNILFSEYFCYTCWPCTTPLLHTTGHKMAALAITSSQLSNINFLITQRERERGVGREQTGQEIKRKTGVGVCFIPYVYIYMLIVPSYFLQLGSLLNLLLQVGIENFNSNHSKGFKLC